MDSLHSSFIFQNPGDLVWGMNGFVFMNPVDNTPDPKTPMQLTTLFPQWFKMENNTNGVPRLCTTKIMDQPLTLTAGTAITQYQLEPSPFEPVYFLDGHPTTVPVFKPK